MRRLVASLLALIPWLGLVGCGTSAYSSTFRVVVQDPAGVLRSGPVRVGLFDVAGGDTVDWASRTVGNASDGAPYKAKISTVETRGAFDGGPPGTVKAGLYLPDWREHGWYSLELHPSNGKEQEMQAPFVAFDGYGSLAQGVPPLSVTMRPKAVGDAWEIELRVRLGTERPNENVAVPASDPLTAQLIVAASKGDQAEVERLLLKGAQVNGADATGQTALLAAVRAGQLDVARYLAQNRADVNLADKNGESAYLAAASLPGQDDLLLVTMLNARPKIGATDAAGDTALIRASKQARLSAIRRLLTAGEPVNQANTAGRTALHELLLSGQCTADATSAAQLLIGSGADVNKPLEDGRLPLTIAHEKGCAEIVALLEKAGAKAN